MNSNRKLTFGLFYFLFLIHLFSLIFFSFLFLVGKKLKSFGQVVQEVEYWPLLRTFLIVLKGINKTFIIIGLGLMGFVTYQNWLLDFHQCNYWRTYYGFYTSQFFINKCKLIILIESCKFRYLGIAKHWLICFWKHKITL